MKLLIRLNEGTFTLADAAAADYLRGKGHHADYMVAFDLGEFAFADRLHDCVSCDEVQISAVANQKAGIAKFVDEARCAMAALSTASSAFSSKTVWVQSAPRSFSWI